MLAPYAWYRDTYGGKLTEEEYKPASFRADAYLRQLTTGRCDNPNLPGPVANAVKGAACALADYLVGDGALAAAQGVAQETNDGVSVTYANRSQQEEATRQYQLASAYLGWTGLLYRGMGGGGCPCGC